MFGNTFSLKFLFIFGTYLYMIPTEVQTRFVADTKHWNNSGLLLLLLSSGLSSHFDIKTMYDSIPSFSFMLTYYRYMYIFFWFFLFMGIRGFCGLISTEYICSLYGKSVVYQSMCLCVSVLA